MGIVFNAAQRNRRVEILLYTGIWPDIFMCASSPRFRRPSSGSIAD